MSLSPTIPNLYKYGFLTSRTVDFLTQPESERSPEKGRELLLDCKELIEKIIRGEKFVIGPNPSEVHNLRPDDVQTFAYVLSNDSQFKSRAKDEPSLSEYLEDIKVTLDSLIADPLKSAGNPELKKAVGFLARLADALLETARENAREVPQDEQLPPANE